MNRINLVNMISMAAKVSGLFACIFFADAISAQVPKPDQLFEKISPSIWIVTTFDAAERRMSQGSAVVIGPGTLITNCHVLARAKSFVIKQDNVIYGASLAYADAERDLCQIKVKNFSAPAVNLAATTQLKVGQKVFAIGNPRGLELSFSDGMVSGLRKSDDDNTIVRVQTTAPISPGSSGGGLFDERGQLVGITSSGLKDSQNLNFAIPADWIKEVPARAKDALAKRIDPENAAVAAGPSPQKKGPYYLGQIWTYSIVDRMTHAKQAIALQVDRFDGDAIIFNRGRRVESPNGNISGPDSSVLSELDALNTSGGWIRIDDDRAQARNIDGIGSNGDKLELQGSHLGNSKVVTPAGDFDVLVFRYLGYRRSTQVVGINFRSGSPYDAMIWYAPAIHRIVKMTVSSEVTQSSKLAPSGFTTIDQEIVLERYDQ